MTKVVVSKKQIISIDEFMNQYIGKEYDGNGKLTHKEMNRFLMEKGISIPERVNFNMVHKEDLLNGTYIVVKDHHSQTLIYRNPKNYSLSGLLQELNSSQNLQRIEKVRKQILSTLGYQEERNGVINRADLEDEYILESPNRQKQFIIRNNTMYRKRHY